MSHFMIFCNYLLLREPYLKERVKFGLTSLRFILQRNDFPQSFIKVVIEHWIRRASVDIMFFYI